MLPAIANRRFKPASTPTSSNPSILTGCRRCCSSRTRARPVDVDDQRSQTMMTDGATVGDPKPRSALRMYGVAVLIALVVTAVKLTSGSFLGRDAPFALLGLGIVIAGWQGGARAAGVATALLMVSCLLFFLGEPRPALASAPTLLQLGSLLVEGAAIGAVVSVMDRGRVQTQRAVERAHRLQTLTAALTAARTPEEVGDVVIRQAMALLGPSTGALATMRDDGRMELIAHQGQSEQTIQSFAVFSADDPLPAARAFRSGASEWIEDAATFAVQYPVIAATEVHGKAAAVSLPL